MTKEDAWVELQDSTEQIIKVYCDSVLENVRDIFNGVLDNDPCEDIKSHAILEAIDYINDRLEGSITE